MIENFYMRFFNFLASYQRVMRVLAYWDPQNFNDIYLNVLLVGREIGKSVRILFEFQLTDAARDSIHYIYYLDQDGW